MAAIHPRAMPSCRKAIHRPSAIHSGKDCKMALPDCGSSYQSPEALPLRRILAVLTFFRRVFLEPKLKLLHAHFSTAELYSFHLQTEALIQTILAGQSDPAARRHHTMPGESVRLIQHAHNLTRCAGKAGGLGAGSVAANVTARNLQI